MDWVKKGINYWENPECPKEYLEGALVRLIEEIEGTTLPVDYFKGLDRKELQEKVAFYEYVSDK